MKHLRRISLLALFSLCTVIGCAERETVKQSFNSMYPSAGLDLSADNKTGTTDLLTYTCTGGTEFWKDHVYGTRTSIVLAVNGGAVTTTRVDELIGFTITSLPLRNNSNVKVYVSRDSVDFGDPLTETNVTYDSSGGIDVSLRRGNYYIKLVNTDKSSKCSLTRIDYYLDHCNCFEYIPE